MKEPKFVSHSQKPFKCGHCEQIIPAGSPYWWMYTTKAKGDESRHDTEECRFTEAEKVSTPRGVKSIATVDQKADATLRAEIIDLKKKIELAKQQIELLKEIEEDEAKSIAEEAAGMDNSIKAGLAAIAEENLA